MKGQNKKTMNYEIISIETARKLAEYERLKKELEKLVKKEGNYYV